MNNLWKTVAIGLNRTVALLALFLVTASGVGQTSNRPIKARFLRPGLVFGMAFQDDGKVIIGGYFSIVNGVTRNNIARLNPDGSVDPAWNPGANNAVRQLIINGADVFALGDFSVIGGQTRDGLAKLSLNGNGSADSLWNPEHAGNLHALAISGTNLFVGGLSYLAKLSTSGTGVGSSQWDPQPDININVLLIRGTDLYAAGNFEHFANFSRSRLAKIDEAGNLDAVWDPDATGGNLGYIPALAATDDYLYVGGSFLQVGGQNRSCIARLSLDGTGQADASWDPMADREMVYALAVTPTNVYAAGSFSEIGGASRSALARLSIAGPGTADPSWNPAPDGWVTALALRNDSLFVGGNFATISGEFSPSLAKLDALTGVRDGSFNAQVGYLESGSSLLQLTPDEGLTLVGIPGGTYQIEYAESLNAPGGWLPFSTVTLTGETLLIPEGRFTNANQRLYRARLMP